MTAVQLTTTSRKEQIPMRYIRVLIAVAALALVGLPSGVSHAAPDPSQFAITEASGSLSTLQAGAHADFTSTFAIARDESTSEPHAKFRDTAVDLPPGLIGNSQLFPTCPADVLVGFQDFGSEACPLVTQVGTVAVTLPPFGPGSLATIHEPLYNLPAPEGSPARLGFIAFLLPIVIDFEVRSDGDYGITAAVRGASQVRGVSKIEVTTWGVPADPSHDAMRVTPQEAAFRDLFGVPAPSNSSPLAPAPFMSNATNCAPSNIHFDLTTYRRPGEHFTADAALPALSGCEQVPFLPGMETAPTSDAEGAPTGVDFDLTLPQGGLEDPNRNRQADLRKAVVTLPEGMTINPSSAKGREGCTPEQIGLVSTAPVRFDAADPACLDASKVGEVQVETPLLPDPLKGGLFLAQQGANPFGSLLAGYLVAQGNGVTIKLAGRFDLDPQTGRVTATFDNNPQLPFSNMHLKIYGGPQGPLTNPGCGTHSVNAVFEGWNGASVERTSEFTIDEGCTAPQFKPSAQAGLANPVAGSSSAFSLRVGRSDADSEIKTVATKLPRGLLAKVAGVRRCSEAQASAGACPAGSQIGRVEAGAGSGPDPFYIQGGKVFLTDGYKGAPFGLLVQVPAVAGPFDLGVVNVRAALRIDPNTAQASVVADSMPRMLQGIPLQVRDVRVTVDREGFMRAPTSCEAMSVGVTVGSYLGETADLSSRFQVGDCSSLGFVPRLGLRVTGRKQMRTNGHPGVRAVVRQGSGQAAIERAVVRLPKALALDPDNAGALCEFADGTRPDLENHCPAGSVVGRARAVTPLLNKPLSGNVYFVKNVRIDKKTGNQIRTLPMIVVALRGEIALNLRGTASVKGGRLVNTFAGVPDAPVSRFNLNIKGGQNGILAVTSSTRGPLNLCRGTQAANVKMNGHNGKTRTFTTALKRPCAPRAAARR